MRQIAVVLGSGLAMPPAKERWIEEGLLGGAPL